MENQEKSKIKYETELSNGTKIDPFIACGVIEGFVDCPTKEDGIKVWSYLIGTGVCWSLQGFYGRTANNLIENGIITKEGEINYEALEQC